MTISFGLKIKIANLKDLCFHFVTARNGVREGNLSVVSVGLCTSGSHVIGPVQTSFHLCDPLPPPLSRPVQTFHLGDQPPRPDLLSSG